MQGFSRQSAYFFTSLARYNQVSITVSGFNETVSMPSSTNHLAKSGWSDGALPADADIFVVLAAGGNGQMQHNFNRRIALVERGSNRTAAVASTPKVSWVISFEPIEKPSKYCRNCSAKKRVARHFAHHNQAQAVFYRALSVGFSMP